MQNWSFKIPGKLDLSGCSNLDQFPTELEKIKSLTMFNVDGIDINKIQSTTSDVKPWSWLFNPFLLKPRKCLESICFSLASLASCMDLDLSKYPISSLSKSIKGLIGLQSLRLSHCTRLQSLPELPMGLEFLDVGKCSSLEMITNLPNWITYLALKADGCEKLVEVQGIFKLEPIGNADAKIVNSLGLTELESMGSLEVDLWNNITNTHKRYLTTPKLGFSGGFLPPLKPLTAVLTAVALPPFMRMSEKMVMFNLWPRVVTTRQSFAGAPLAKTAVINGGNERALAAVLLPLLKVGFSGGFVTAVKRGGCMNVVYTSNKRSGPSISVTVPSVTSLPYLKIQALNVYVLYAFADEDSRGDGDFECIIIQNKTKGHTCHHSPTFICCPNENNDVVWLSHWMIAHQLMEVGDDVNLSVHLVEGFKVKEVRFQIVYDEHPENVGDLSKYFSDERDDNFPCHHQRDHPCC
ncbi:hypothetical protein ACSBR1_004089 [Camellia fascicularis]